MRTIIIKSFHGCPSGEELAAKLIEYKEQEGFDLVIEKIPTADLAEEYGLYGSPTLLINGVEFQKERRGSPGFY